MSPKQIMDLGANFATFVNELLRLELASTGLGGGHLTTTYRENVSDEGIDTGLRHTVATRYVPAGESAWQFKAGDLGPAGCRTELRNAKSARRVLEAGGVYRLAVGADLNAAKVRRRLAALEEEAAALGIDVHPDTFRVFNAVDLADWASDYPAMAASALIGGVGDGVIPFHAWAEFSRMGGTWVDSTSRQDLAAEVHRTITDPAAPSLHVEGVSGVGKSRAVLEALRGEDFAALVVYVPSAGVPTAVPHRLHAHKRQAIVIIDHCDAEQHELLSEQLPQTSTVKLITIGEPSGHRPVVRPYQLPRMEQDALWRLARAYRPSLPPEHCQVVVDVADGNPKLAQLLADDLASQPRGTVVELLTDDVINSLVSRAVPDGPAFLACLVLALLPAVRFDDDAHGELACLAAAFDLTVNDLRSASNQLDRVKLVNHQGSYRAIAPYPLALYLAGRAWRELHDRIERRLLPTVDVTMAEPLFRRAVDCGALDSAGPVVMRQLGLGGQYATLDPWGRGAESTLLIHFAALAPRATGDYLTHVLAGMTDEHVASVPSRTVFTRAAERLAWHTATFHGSADMLLMLAATTVSDYPGPPDNLARNSSVRSWTDLFGVHLPTTAARPDRRLRYLRTTANSADARHRILSVEAARRILTFDELSSAAAGMQGTLLTEPRGAVTNPEEATRYLCGAMDLLGDLARDKNDDVAKRATKRLVEAIHPMVALALAKIRHHLAATIAALPENGVTAARTELGRLEELFRNAGHLDPDQIVGRRERLAEFSSRMPTATAEQRLDAVAHARRWDFRDGSLPRRLIDAARALPNNRGVSHLLTILQLRPEATFEIGLALGELAPDDDHVRDELVADARDDASALIGYLTAHVQSGASGAFDDLLDRPDLALPDLTRLRVSTEGPPTARASARVSALLPGLSPADGADALRRWQSHVDIAHLRDYVADWLPRLNTADDYAAILDVVAGIATSRPDEITAMDEDIAGLIGRRRQHRHLPDRGQWGWEVLARQQVATKPVEVAALLVELLDADAYPEFSALGDDALLRDTVAAAGGDGWRIMIEHATNGSHRVRAAAGRWLGNAADLDVIREWVGGDADRARVVATHTGPDAHGLSPTARFLIAEFSTDEQIPWLLRHQLLPLSYSGGEAAMYQRVLDQIAETNFAESDPVARWLEETVDWLRDLTQAARRTVAP